MSQESSSPAYRVVVVGASAGGVEVLRALVSMLPARLPAAVLVVLHVSPTSVSVLDAILTRAGSLKARYPQASEAIRPGHVYVAPPDRHLVVEPGLVKVVNGPKENRHRPAIDTLFRSAARAYGDRVIGIVLSGSGDDGSAGLAMIRQQGGIAVVQDPDEAITSAMPRNALEAVPEAKCLPIQQIAELIVSLCGSPLPDDHEILIEDPAPTALHLSAPERDPSHPENGEIPGPLEGFSCPHCHGHLWETHEAGSLVFRCRVGHMFSIRALLDEWDDQLERTLWAAVNGFQEAAAISRRLAKGAELRGQNAAARRLADRAHEAEQNSSVLRDLLSQKHAIAPES